MDIANGSQARKQYLNFIKRTSDETLKMLKALLKYCGQDTFAMVELLRVIKELI